MEQVKILTHRNLTAYLMEAGQDLLVRHGQVFDSQGRELAKIEPHRKCCEYHEGAEIDLGLTMDIWY